MAGKKTQAPKTAKKSVGQAVVNALATGADPITAMTQTIDANKTGQDSAEAFALFGPGPTAPKPKKGEEVLSRKQQIEILRSTINDSFKGKAILRSGAEITNVFVLRRPTGITTLDIALGGGLPAGGLTQIIGKYSAGKSYLANRIMAMAQQTYGEEFAASVNMTEQRYDKAFAKTKCGIRIPYSRDEIAVFQSINAQHGNPEFTPEYLAWLQDGVGSFIEGVGGTAEQILEAAVQQVESNLFQVVLIDSFGALLTAAEAEAEEGLEQKHRGGAAMVITQFMHRLHAALNLPDKYGRQNTTTVIGINQYRDNVNAGVYGNPMKVAGGNSLAHGKLVDIHVEQGSKIKVGKDYTVIGKEIHWEITKGKAGCHDGPKGTYKFYFGEHGTGFGIDIYTDLLVAGLQTEVIEQAGAWYSFNGERLGQGQENAAYNIAQRPELLQTVRREIFRKAGLNFITKENI